MLKKTSTLIGTTIILLLCCSCSTIAPQPIDPNGKSVSFMLPEYSRQFLFAEERDSLKIAVKSTTSNKNTVADYVKNSIHSFNVSIVQNNVPCDIKIIANAAYSTLSPAPQCRMKGELQISVFSNDGKKMMRDWKHTAESHKTSATSKDAEKMISADFQKNIAQWASGVFANDIDNKFGISVLRFKLSRSLIELDSNKFDKELGHLTERLRKTGGILNVRLIEADKNTRIASFRVLYQKKHQYIKTNKKQ